MLNPEFKARWIAALTDGSFKHGTGALRPIEGSYCCLGVACELMGAEISDGGRTAFYGDDDDGDGGGGTGNYGLPRNLINELDLCYDDLEILAEHNDAHVGEDFPQTVIDYIQNL